MKINIEILESAYGKFSDVALCFTDTKKNYRKVNLKIYFEPIYDFSADVTTVRFDFFLISTIIYGIDNLVNRSLYSNDGWARDIEVELPVQNVLSWKGQEDDFKQLLDFLTGDNWKITFSQLQVKNIFTPRARRRKSHIPIYDKKNIELVTLFSGGLDSLIGVINSLEDLAKDKKIILASHFDSSSVGPNSDQTKLEAILSKHYRNNIYWVQSVITLSRGDTKGVPVIVEDSYRSRSLLFIGIGVYLCQGSINTGQLLIPENGTISINYPLTPSRTSSLSTRTTHPFVLKTLEQILSNVRIQTKLVNPYSLLTKGEMVSGCRNQTVLEKTYEESVSCGKRGRKQHWDIKNGTQHCGVCMPCIYRRGALHKKSLDTQTYGIDILSASSIDNYVDMPALFDYLKTNLSKEKIKRDLLVNGTLDFGSLDDYAEVVIKSRKELFKWFADKGNPYIKAELGIK